MSFSGQFFSLFEHKNRYARVHNSLTLFAIQTKTKVQTYADLASPRFFAKKCILFCKCTANLPQVCKQAFVSSSPSFPVRVDLASLRRHSPTELEGISF
jgi:hypothetical protein